MMLFTSTLSLSLTAAHFRFLFHSFLHTVIPYAFSSLIFKRSSGRQQLQLHHDSIGEVGGGGEAAGDMPEGMLLKHVLTTKARLGSGGE